MQDSTLICRPESIFPRLAPLVLAAGLPSTLSSFLQTDVETTMTSNDSKVTAFYEDVDHLKKLCDFLRSRQGPPIREALLMDKRVHYLKGKYAK
jgi:hypothetical protein